METMPDSPVATDGRGAPRPTTGRQLPRPSELSELLRLRRPTLDPVGRRLSRALSIGDLRDIAARTTPRSVFDYVDGAARRPP